MMIGKPDSTAHSKLFQEIENLLDANPADNFTISRLEDGLYQHFLRNHAGHLPFITRSAASLSSEERK
jgi:hypothetical protein